MFLVQFIHAGQRTFALQSFATREEATQYVRDMRRWEEDIPPKSRTKTRVVSFDAAPEEEHAC